MNPDRTQTLEETLAGVVDQLKMLDKKIDKVAVDQERFNDRFSDYQKATQWVVQLAFTLIASATLTIIITAVFKR
jgi:hypothetical protein